MIFDLKKQGSVFVGIVYTFLFCFAILFYFERLNSDAGYYFFLSVNSRWFHVEHSRLVLIFAEILPVLGSTFHLPLKALAILYSLNHVIYSAILTLICLRIFKNLNAAILITLLQFAGIKFSIFTPQFELFYGLSLLILTLSYIQYIDNQKPNWKIKNFFILSLLLILIFTSHPMAIYCTFAGIILYFSDKQHWRIIITIFLFLVLYLIWKRLYISDYEQSKFRNFNNVFDSNFIQHYLNFNFLRKGIIFSFKYYADVWLIFMTGMIYLIKNNLFIRPLLNILLLLGSLLISWIMFEPDSMGRYIEQVYFPFVFIACLWLFKFTLNRKIVLLIFSVFIYRSYLIIEASDTYLERANQIAEFAKAAQHQVGTKFYVTENEMGEKLYEQGNWSYGFETLIYSAMNCNKTISITKLEDLEYNNNLQILKHSDYLFRPFDILPIQSLNRQYFNLTEGDYQLLKTDQ